MAAEKFPSLFIPGPTNVAPEVLQAQTAPMIGHRSAAFESLFEQIQDKLRYLFYTNSRVYVVAASGSGLQEAAIRNGVQHKVVNFVNGAFAQRWHQVSLGCAKEAIRVDVPWGQAIKPDAVLAALDDHTDTEAITVVLNETSTGVLSPVGEIAAQIHRYHPNVLLLVDAVSGFAGIKIPFDEWGLDVCLTSSQKALAAPPGLAMAAVSDRTLVRAETISGRGWYFDFLNLEKYMKRNTTPATPAISLMWALNEQLNRILAEGRQARFERHQLLAERTRQWAVDHGFGLYAEPGYASPTVTNISNTRQIDVAVMLARMRHHGYALSNGYGDLKGRAFRIAHMGDVTPPEMETMLRRLSNTIDELA